MASQAVHIVESDLRRVATVLAEERRWPAVDRLGWRALAERVEHARILPDEEAPGDLVTLRSRVRVTDVDSGTEAAYLLVTPVQASSLPGLISVASPMGAALLGCRVGDETEFRVPGGLRRIRIDEVLPAAGRTRRRPAAAVRDTSATGPLARSGARRGSGHRLHETPAAAVRTEGARRPWPVRRAPDDRRPVS